MKKISILGSTGSIGTQTLEIVRENKDLQVVAITANRQVELCERQAREFVPKLVCMMEETAARELKIRLADTDIRVVTGIEGMIEAATIESADIVVTAVVGMIGLRPTIEAIRAGKDIALANKETLVTAGHIIMPLAGEKQVSILPVDSEHSAIFQSLQGQRTEALEEILLTASGGPFLGKTAAELDHVTVEAALKHPNWAMGRKITIDSATMVNKGLEMIEAKWLFGVDIERVHVVVHPQSIVHSGVCFRDGAVIVQMGVPDMKLPIQYALYYPDRRPMTTQRLKLSELGSLTFREPDYETFRGLELAVRAAKYGRTMPTVFNAANEKAVELFLQGKIGFLDIYRLIEGAMDNHRPGSSDDIDSILESEQEAYRYIEAAL